MNQEDRELEFVRRHLQSALPPCEARLETDLWPRWLRRRDQSPASFGWLEAVLVALVVVVMAVFPDLLTAMLYHL